MMAKPNIGSVVQYVDEVGKAHDALVTCVFGNTEPHSINVMYVSSDEKKEDSYGRQVERETSVVHESMQGAHGQFWK